MAAFGTLIGSYGVALTSATASVAATGSSTVIQQGDLVFAVFAQETNLTVTAVTDNRGHTYTATNIGTDAGAITGRAFYTRATSTGALTSVTASAVSSTLNCAFIAAVFAGPFDISPVDQNIANQTTDTSSPFVCPSVTLTAFPSELLVGWATPNYGTAWTASTGWAMAHQLATATVGEAILGYAVVASTTSGAAIFTAGANPTQVVLGTTTFLQSQDALLGQGVL